MTKATFNMLYNLLMQKKLLRKHRVTRSKKRIPPCRSFPQRILEGFLQRWWSRLDPNQLKKYVRFCISLAMTLEIQQTTWRDQHNLLWLSAIYPQNSRSESDVKRKDTFLSAIDYPSIVVFLCRFSYVYKFWVLVVRITWTREVRRSCRVALHFWTHMVCNWFFCLQRKLQTEHAHCIRLLKYRIILWKWT